MIAWLIAWYVRVHTKVSLRLFVQGTVHKGRHLRLGGEGVRQMVTQSDMEGGGVYQKVTSPLNVQKINEFFPQESAASPKFV